MSRTKDSVGERAREREREGEKNSIQLLNYFSNPPSSLFLSSFASSTRCTQRLDPPTPFEPSLSLYSRKRGREREPTTTSPRPLLYWTPRVTFRVTGARIFPSESERDDERERELAERATQSDSALRERDWECHWPPFDLAPYRFAGD